MRRGGAEKVARVISDMYPDAPVYTLCYQPELTYPEYKGRNIKTSWYQVFAKNEKLMKWLFFPLGLMAMKSLDLSEYDLVIMSTTYCAKYVKTGKNTMVVAYCYTPFRLAWNPESYNVYQNSRGLKRMIFNFVVNRLRKIDFRESRKVDYFVAMTEETRRRLVDAYKPKSDIPIINPAVELNNYGISEKIGDYFLVVSRFEPYKKVDLVIEAFNRNGKKLIIVGKGSQEEKLKNLAQGDIEFRQNLSNEELAEMYMNCKALIFPQHEDYGLTPLEANAAGRPVIAYNKGGVLDTMKPYRHFPQEATALLFDEQDVDSLNEAIGKFEELEFKPSHCRENAERFSEEAFIRELENYIAKISK